MHYLYLLFLFPILHVYALQVTPLSQIENLRPGESKQIAISLVNDSDRIEEIHLSQSDYANNCEGNHFYQEAGTQPRSNSSWIRMHTQREVLAPNKTVMVYYTITVPNDNNLNGSYWSIILIEPVAPLKTIQDAQGFNLEVKMRYGYSMITNVGEGKSKLKVIDKQFKTIQEKNVLAIDVLNTGNLFLKPKLSLKLYGPTGKLEKTLEAIPESLYPDCSQRFVLDYEGCEGKQFTAFLLLDAGENHLFADTFKLSFPQ